MTGPRHSTPKTVQLMLLATLLAAAPLRAAEPHAILARGFEADQVYDFNDIDHVNLFNGNLVVTLPLGQRYPVNAGFEYGFTLVYNSHVWDFVLDCPGDGKDEFGEGSLHLIDPGSLPDGCTRGLPNQSSNAGTSWRLTLGELYDIDSPLMPGRGWVFVGPDGAERHFGPPEGGTAEEYPHFTKDSSYLRLRPSSSAETPACAGVFGTCMVVEHPDGVIYAFEPADSLAGWRLRRIQDRFGNWVEITHFTSQWTVTDSVGRLHTVAFDAEGMVSELNLAAFAGATAQYGFTIEDSPPTPPGCPHDFDIEGESELEILSYLTSVTRPDGSSYSFTYWNKEGTDALCTHADGRLHTLTLPTGGEISYDYAGYLYPIPECDRPPVRGGNEPRIFTSVAGVVQRTTRDLDGNPLAESHYVNGGLLAKPSNDASTGVCIRPTTTFTDVYEKADQGKFKMTRNFFTILQAGDPDLFLKYGLPQDAVSPDSRNPKRLRSTMVFECPSFPPESLLETLEKYGPNCAVENVAGCWPHEKQHLMIPTNCYDVNGDGSTDDRFLSPEEVRGLRDVYMEHEADGGFSEANPRVKSRITYFYDSQGDFFVENVQSDFDGFGHYRTLRSRSNSPGSVERKTTVAYRPEVTAQRWILSLFDEKTVTEGGQTARESFVFDRASGFLQSRTTHRAGGNLVTTLTPTADGLGNVKTETFSGGDPGRASYVIEHQYQNGTRSRSDYLRGNETILRTLDADIDPNTGFPEASRDESGLETNYSFDALGRLTSVAQQGSLAEAPTTYSYQKADPNRAEERASVTVTRADTTSTTLFNGLGRVNEQHTTLPDGTISRRFTTFTPMGQASTVTTLHDASTPGSARKTRTLYDIFGRPARVFHPDDGLTSSGQSQTFFFYDSIFKTSRQINHVETPEGPERFRTVYVYDHQRRLVEVKEMELDSNSFELRLSTKYSYDEGGRLFRVSQGGGSQIRKFIYDEGGLLTKECHPELADGCIEYGGFDARGNPARLRYSEPGGNAFELDYAYDAAERLTQVRSAADGRLLKEFFYTNLYGGAFSPAQGNGKLFQAKRHNYLGPLDVVATVTNTWGGIGGRLSSRTVATGGDGDVPRVRFTTDYAYDSLGNLAQVTYPGCDQVGCESEAPFRSVTSSYTRGLLTSVGTPGAPSRYASLTYHPNGTVHQVIHGNGVRDDIAQDPSQMTRPGGIEVRTGATPGSGTLWQATYGYDGAGNVVSRASTGFNNSGTLLFNGTDLFRYDNAFNRLLTAAIHYPLGSGGTLEGQSYAYDPFGNLTSISGSNPRNLSPSSATNRLQGSFTYDPAGNLTSQPGWDASGNPNGLSEWFYTYDPFNMMTRTQKAGGSVTREYLYTADDERLAVLADGRELWTVRGAANRVLRDVEYLSTGWRWVEDYIHRDGSLLASEGDVTGERHYHLDHLGSPRLVTDAFQQIKARHVHAPYGEELTSTNQDELRMKFTGHERDDLDTSGSAGDLDYMHARYYSPHPGRFLSLDSKHRDRPTRLPQRWNRYAYSTNNPLKYFDPDGEDLKLVFDFQDSGLSSKQQTQVTVGTRKRFANAGVTNVQIFSRSGSTKPTVSKPTDRVVILQFTGKDLKEGRTVFGKNRPPSNKATVSTAHAPAGAEEMTNFLINVGAHEAAHASRALPQYDNDQFPLGSMLNPEGAEPGTIMEQGVAAEDLGAEIREFSEEDAEDLREALNEPEPEPE